MFTPSFTPRGKHSLMFRKMEFANRGSTSLGDKVLPLRVKFTPEGESSGQGARLKTGLKSALQV
jgi:hypothetical protein